MTNIVSLFAFGTFGNPNGFQQTFFDGAATNASLIKTFDLNTNAIKLFPGSKVYAVRKEFVGGNIIISYSVYSYAKEMNSDRSGTFIGCGLAFTNTLPNARVLVISLNEIHNGLIHSNLKDYVLQVPHSKNLTINRSENYSDLNKGLETFPKSAISFSGDKKLVVYCSTEETKLSVFFKEAIDLLSDYDTIYFTGNTDVVEFVGNKRIYPLLQEVPGRNDWQKALREIEVERERKTQRILSDFQREIDEIKTAKEGTLENYKRELEHVKVVFAEAEKILKSSPDEMMKIAGYYDDFIQKSDQLFTNLKNANIDRQEVLETHIQNKKLFNESLETLRKPQYKVKLEKQSRKNKLNVQEQKVIHQTSSIQTDTSDKEDLEVGKNLRFFQIATLISLLLLVASWIYFVNSRNAVQEPIRVEQEKPRKEKEKTKTDREEDVKVISEKLEPLPTGNLNDNDWRAVAKHIKEGQPLDEVVNEIFRRNRNDIERTYREQKDRYGKVLLEMNKNSFKNEDNKVIYTAQDSIRNIPCYKISK